MKINLFGSGSARLGYTLGSAYVYPNDGSIYKFTCLPIGRFYVKIDDMYYNDIHYEERWYPGTADKDPAQSFPITSGTVIDSLVFTLIEGKDYQVMIDTGTYPKGVLKGKVSCDDTLLSLDYLDLYLYYPTLEDYAWEYCNEEGEFEIEVRANQPFTLKAATDYIQDYYLE